MTTQVPNGVLAFDGGALSGFRNRIINGDMRVAQRGTNVNSGIATVTYTLDRWIVYAAGAAVSVVQGPGDGGKFQYALAAQGAASNTGVTVVQRIEASNAYPLAGQTITVRARIYATTTFTPTWSVDYANATDLWTGQTNVATGSFVSCTGPGWTDVSFTTTLNAGCQNGFEIQFVFGATLSGNTKGLTGVQLELGTVATPFETRPIGMELALCQRYYETGSSYIRNDYRSDNAAGFGSSSQFAVVKRISPTMGIGSTTGSAGTTAGAITALSASSFYASATGVVSVGGVSAQVFQCSWTASAELL